MAFATSVARSLPTSLKNKIRNSEQLQALTGRVYGALLGNKPQRVASGPLAGVLLASSSHLSHAHISGSYELAIQNVVDQLVTDGDVCYDLGASVGYFALLMARRASMVYAFELSPVALGEFCRHLALNPNAPILVIPLPLSDATRAIKFGVVNTAYGSGIISESETRWPVLPLETITIDAFAETHRPPNVLKIDVEGLEADVLRGAERTIAAHHPRICCELHNVKVSHEVIAILKGHGYTLTNPAGQPFAVPDVITTGQEVHVIAR